MLLVIILLTLITVFSLIYLALTVYLLEEDVIAIRLRAIASFIRGRSNDEALARPFKQRIVFPQVGKIASRLNRFSLQAIRKWAEEKIGMAGFKAHKFLLLWGVLVCVLSVVIIVLMRHMGTPAQKIIGIAIGTAFIGFYIPFLLNKGKLLWRKTNIQKVLPDVLDFLAVSVEAGLDFTGALAKLAEQMEGPLVDEFTRSLQEMHMGMPRREALQAIGNRCGVEAVSLLITNIIQADQLGESIANVLRVHSAAIREQRRQRAEEKAQTVKILVLLVLWTLSAIFVVLLALR